MIQYESIPETWAEWRPRLRRPLVVGGILSALIGVILLFVSNRYTSRARLLPTTQSDFSGNMAALSAMTNLVGLNLPGGDQTDQSVIEIYQSQWLGEQLLSTVFEFNQSGLFYWMTEPTKQTLDQFLGEKQHDKALQALTNLMTVETSKKTGLITLNVETTSAELSQKINQRALLLLEQFLGNKGRTRGGQKVMFTKQRLEEAKQELGDAEEALIRFSNANRNYSGSQDPRIRITGARLENELALKRQVMGTLAVNLENSLLEEKNDMAVLNILDAPNLPDLPSKPPRLPLVVLSFVFGACCMFLIENRGWLRAQKGTQA